MTDEQCNAWTLSKNDRGILEEIKNTIWTWRTRARSGHDLLAIGAVLTALQTILDGEYPGVIARVGLTNATGHSDEELEIDGQCIEIAISDDGIELSRMIYNPTGQGRSSDHQPNIFTILTRSGGFSMSQTERWRSDAKQLMAHAAVIEASIDALPDYF
jgi:hypothetical protein